MILKRKKNNFNWIYRLKFYFTVSLDLMEKEKKRGQAPLFKFSQSIFNRGEEKGKLRKKSKQSHIEILGKKNYNCRKWRGERKKKGNNKKRKEWHFLFFLKTPL